MNKLQKLKDHMNSKTPYERRTLALILSSLILAGIRTSYSVREKYDMPVNKRKRNFYFYVSPVLLALARIETELKYINNHLNSSDTLAQVAKEFTEVLTDDKK